MYGVWLLENFLSCCVWNPGTTRKYTWVSLLMMEVCEWYFRCHRWYSSWRDIWPISWCGLMSKAYLRLVEYGPNFWSKGLWAKYMIAVLSYSVLGYLVMQQSSQTDNPSYANPLPQNFVQITYSSNFSFLLCHGDDDHTDDTACKTEP